MKTSDNQLITQKKKQGFRVYDLKGIEEKVIARKGGPSFEQVKEAPAYQQLRNHQREFGTASMMAKAVRQSLPKSLLYICESYVSGRLTARFRKLAQLEPGVTGSRPLLMSKHGSFLRGFEFNSRHPFGRIFQANFMLKPSSTRGHLIFHFPSYIPEKKIRSPKGSTHFNLYAHLIAISDFTCEGRLDYFPRDAENHGRYSTLNFGMQPLCRIPLEPLTTQISISNGINLSPDSGLVLLIGIQFFRYQNAGYQRLKEGNALKIYEVF